MSTAALSLAMTLVVEPDGTTWGEQATDAQLADMRRILDPSGPRLGFTTRPRGGGKTRDLAVALVAVALADLPPGSMCHGAAVDGDQARLLLDSVRSIVAGTPHVRGLFEFTATRAFCPSRAVGIEILPADGPSAYGLRSRCLVVDELFQWPDTDRHRSFWQALFTTVQKDPACRLVLLSTAGHPDHWAIPLWERAGSSPAWWRSQHPGPPPWQSAEVIEELRATLPDGQFRRLVLNEFAAGADQAFATEAQLARIFRGEDDEVRPEATRRYCAGLDLSVSGDNAGLAVAHLQQTRDGQRVVVDLVRTWKPTKAKPLSQEEVFAVVLGLAEEYRPLTVHADAYQSVGLLERLRDHGLATETFNYSARSKSALGAMALRLLREGLWSLPPDPQLLREFKDLQVVERPDGSFFVEVPRSARGHGDTAEAVMLASHWLLEGQPRTFRRYFWNGTPSTAEEGSALRFGGLDERAFIRDRLRRPGGKGDPRLAGRR